MKLSDYKEQKDIKDLVTGKLFEEEKVQEIVIPLVEEKKIENTIELIEAKLPEESKIEEPKPKKCGIEEYKKQQEIKKAIEESFKELVNIPKLIKKDNNIIIEGTGEVTRQDIINSVVEKLKDDPLFLDKVKELKEEENIDDEPKPVDQPNRSTAFTGGGFTVTQINSIIDEYFITHPDAGAVDTVFGRTGNIISQVNDYSASQIKNNSSVSGSHVNNTLNILNRNINSVSATVYHLNSDQIIDRSSATPLPTNITYALNYLNDTLEHLSLSAGEVTSVFGRAADVVATVGDYSASQIKNDSAVSGTYVKQALNVLYNNYELKKMIFSTKTSAYDIITNDKLIRCSGTFMVRLPTANGSGRNYHIKNIWTGTVTLSGGLIDGETTKIIDSRYSNITVVDTDTNTWDII